MNQLATQTPAPQNIIKKPKSKRGKPIDIFTKPIQKAFQEVVNLPKQAIISPVALVKLAAKYKSPWSPMKPNEENVPQQVIVNADIEKKQEVTKPQEIQKKTQSKPKSALKELIDQNQNKIDIKVEKKTIAPKTIVQKPIVAPKQEEIKQAPAPILVVASTPKQVQVEKVNVEVTEIAMVEKSPKPVPDIKDQISEIKILNPPKDLIETKQTNKAKSTQNKRQSVKKNESNVRVESSFDMKQLEEKLSKLEKQIDSDRQAHEKQVASLKKSSESTIGQLKNQSKHKETENKKLQKELNEERKRHHTMVLKMNKFEQDRSEIEDLEISLMAKLNENHHKEMELKNLEIQNLKMDLEKTMIHVENLSVNHEKYVHDLKQEMSAQKMYFEQELAVKSEQVRKLESTAFGKIFANILRFKKGLCTPIGYTYLLLNKK